MESACPHEDATPRYDGVCRCDACHEKHIVTLWRESGDRPTYIHVRDRES